MDESNCKPCETGRFEMADGHQYLVRTRVEELETLVRAQTAVLIQWLEGHEDALENTKFLLGK